MNVLTWQYCSFCSICLKERSIDNEYFVFGGSRILIVTWSHHRKKPTIFGLNLPTYLYHHHALHDQSSLLAVESIFCARLAIIQKYNGGHKWRIQYATRGAMGAIVMSSSSRRTAFSISLATFSGEAPAAVAASFSETRTWISVAIIPYIMLAIFIHRWKRLSYKNHLEIT